MTASTGPTRGAGPSRTGRRPNVLLIMSDQHRGDCLDFVARPDGTSLRVQTPHLRRLAETGVCFTRCYSESPVCVPARAILQTGIHPYRSGIVSNAGVLPQDAPTLAGALAARGYFCQAIGKMHFRPVRTPHGLHRLWLSEEMPGALEDDEFLQFLVAAGYGHVHEPNGNRQLYMLPQVSQLPETHHTTAWTGRQTVAFLRHHVRESTDRPFFCWTSFQKPHPPFEPPLPWHRMYTHLDAPVPEKSADELDWLPSTLRKGGRRRYLGEFPDPGTLALSWAYYFGAISFIDAWIGIIVDELERLGLREDTLVLYTSDHGELLGDHWAAGKDCFYEGAARVPLLASWPGSLPQGQVREQLTGLTDIVPTILEAAGIAAAEHGLAPSGVSLLPVARDGAPTHDVWLGLVGRGISAHVAAITPEWTYVYAAADNRELLFRYREPGGELRDALSAGEAAARGVSATLRRTVQEHLRVGGGLPAAELLDPDSPTGFRLTAAGHAAQRLGAVEDSHWLRRAQYPGWVRALPAGWRPPPLPLNGAIPSDLPLRPDRTPYTWAALGSAPA